MRPKETLDLSSILMIDAISLVSEVLKCEKAKISDPRKHG